MNEVPVECKCKLIFNVDNSNCIIDLGPLLVRPVSPARPGSPIDALVVRRATPPRSPLRDDALVARMPAPPHGGFADTPTPVRRGASLPPSSELSEIRKRDFKPLADSTEARAAAVERARARNREQHQNKFRFGSRDVQMDDVDGDDDDDDTFGNIDKVMQDFDLNRAGYRALQEEGVVGPYHDDQEDHQINWWKPTQDRPPPLPDEYSYCDDEDSYFDSVESNDENEGNDANKDNDENEGNDANEDNDSI